MLVLFLYENLKLVLIFDDCVNCDIIINNAVDRMTWFVL